MSIYIYRNGYSFHSCLENSVNREVWQAIVHEVTKTWTGLRDFHIYIYIYMYIYIYIYIYMSVSP